MIKTKLYFLVILYMLFCTNDILDTGTCYKWYFYEKKLVDLWL